MNLNHLNLLIDDLLNIKYGSQKTKEKTRYKQEFLAFIEKFINFSKTELIDITLLHSLFILIFSGSTLDKIRSIFIIHDLNETENIKSSDFCNYIIHMYYFMLKEIDFDENNLNILSNDLGKNIIDNISKGKDNLGFGDIYNPSIDSFKNAFDDEKLDDFNIYIQKIKQKNEVEFNEDGSIVKSVTMATFGAGSAAPMENDTLDVKLNQPFIYIIRDINGTPIFVGHVDNPTI